MVMRLLLRKYFLLLVYPAGEIDRSQYWIGFLITASLFLTMKWALGILMIAIIEWNTALMLQPNMKLVIISPFILSGLVWIYTGAVITIKRMRGVGISPWWIMTTGVVWMLPLAIGLFNRDTFSKYFTVIIVVSALVSILNIYYLR
jgi:uncharacterized membrane protein YhaH (DUF805 family)